MSHTANVGMKAEICHDAVLVVGAGPVGLTMASELARHGVRCRLIDRAPSPLPYCRAIGVTPRSLEVWEDMGIARSMIDAGLWLTGMRSIVANHPVQDLSAEPLGLPFAQLGLPQYETERILTQHLARFGMDIERGCELTSLKDNPDGVSVTLQRQDGSSVNRLYAYVVGCDGAHSTVRKTLGIDFDGEAYPWPFMLGDVHIAWDVPYGMALRAVRPVEGGPPDLFVAIPLPEAGRYRISMLAPPSLVPKGGTDHGIQAEMKGPSLSDLQAIADDLLPDKPRLSDLRWSSIFRISMRLASHYRKGRVFIAGDAAHIHPPTGGQGMNTGIQDAYNLAWKLALVVNGDGRPELLDSYEAERLPVGADVVMRTQKASENYGREQGKATDHLVDTQVLVSYRETPFVCEDLSSATPGPAAGDRAPDVGGLAREGFGFHLRLFDVLRGSEHVLLIQIPNSAGEMEGLIDFAREFHQAWGANIRVAAIGRTSLTLQVQSITILTDLQSSFAKAYGTEAGAILIRPDGYIGWRGSSWRSPGLTTYLERVFSPREPAS